MSKPNHEEVDRSPGRASGRVAVCAASRVADRIGAAGLDAEEGRVLEQLEVMGLEETPQEGQNGVAGHGHGSLERYMNGWHSSHQDGLAEIPRQGLYDRGKVGIDELRRNAVTGEANGSGILRDRHMRARTGQQCNSE
jgi:hypothetical protein